MVNKRTRQALAEFPNSPPLSDDNWAVALSNFGPVSPKQKAAIKNVLNSTLPLTVEL